jgi:glycosyltransferase involved in cell wall biosynthesis
MLRSILSAQVEDRSLLYVTRRPSADATAFADRGVEVVVLAPDDEASAGLAKLTSSRSTTDRRLRRLLSLPDAADPLAALRRRNPDAVLPMMSVPPRPTLRGAIGWLPDFQHRTLPGFFSAAECATRERAYSGVAKRASVVLLSSHAMREEFERYYHGHRARVLVLPFPSPVVFEELPADPASAVQKYRLPADFVLVANQFWQHKNHELVVEAIRLLGESGIDVPVVMTGLPADYRDPSNATVSRVLQKIATSDLAGKIVVLGQVPYADLVALMRMAAFVLQPSRYEGWNTSVEDAKALGRPVICSDIAVHREQGAGHDAAFFDADDAEGLAAVIADRWSTKEARSAEGEEIALEHARRAAVGYGSKLLEVCDVAATESNGSRGSLARL